jgi:hypothetical protein
MNTIWVSAPIQIHAELHADVKVTASTVTLGTYNDAVQASDLILTAEQAMELADALTEGAAKCLAAQGG